jgi:glycosyltransferase involved in cell wall biosynthesis
VQISAVLISFNEESNIARAIESVKWADEVLVVDSESTDGTREIAERLGARVIVRPWPGFAAQKQFAVESASFDRIFSLDCDEQVSPELAGAIKSLNGQEEVADGYRVSRLAFYMGRAIRHSGWYPDRQLRLFDRRAGGWKEVVVHESVEMAPGSSIGVLRGDLFHFTVTNAGEHHRMIGERYAPLGAQKMFESGRTTNVFKTAFAGPAAFFRSYFAKLGFLDGLPGFCIAWFAAHNAALKHLLLREMQSAETPRNR